MPWWGNTAEDRALEAAAQRGILLVLLPGALAVFGLIWLVRPPLAELKQTWVNGSYSNPCCTLVTMHDGQISIGNVSARYSLYRGKELYVELDRSIRVRDGAVAFFEGPDQIKIRQNSVAVPAEGNVYALEVPDADGKVVLFIRR